MKQLTFTSTNFISKNFGFNWADAELEFLYNVKMSTDKKKLIRKMTMGKKQENHFF